MNTSAHRRLLGLVIGVIAISGVTLAVILVLLRQQTLTAAERLTESLAQVLAEETTRIFQGVELRLELVASRRHFQPPGPLTREAGRALLREEIKAMPFIRALSLADARGMVLYSSESSAEGVSVVDRSYFQEQKQDPSAGFRIGPPIRGRSAGAWLISATRALEPDPAGAFSGLLVAAMEPSYFDDMWGNVDVGPGGSVALFTRQGMLMMRSPPDDGAMGKVFNDLPVLTMPLDTKPNGHFQNKSVFDGTYRIFAYQVLPEHPEMVLVVGQSFEFALAPWRRLAFFTVSLWALASLVIIGFGASLDRIQRKQALIEEALRASEAMSVSILDSVTAEIAVLDTGGRIMAVNEAWKRFALENSIEPGKPTPQTQVGANYLSVLDASATVPPPADSESPTAAREGINGVLEGRLSVFRLEYPCDSPGRRRWFSMNVTPLGKGGKGVVVAHIDITERRLAEETLRKSVAEKEALLKEVHHRVKNNLQVITSLLRLETSRSGEPATKVVLKDMQGRIRSMALLHETLYRSREFGRVDLSDYLRQLTTQLFRAQNAAAESVRLNLDLKPVHLEIDRAIPCGLIVNELVSNSLKHAFPHEGRGEVRVVLDQNDQGETRLQVSDDGQGLPADFEAKRSQSLGLQLVNDLARQLGGRFEVGPPPRAAFAVTFPRKGQGASDDNADLVRSSK